ncbi:hypothetical protein [Pedobacter sp. SYSU D00535]|uniref:hypothetical protein n=1 Tax=Pedobacter sp. SYSU D00535 TaxID=2810308 RepID=UPI001A977630|nr:hypothetical protein [Pedobacter sp. SYSU D00535]
MTSRQVGIFVFTFVLLAACKKEEKVIFSGTYTGEFTVIRPISSMLTPPVEASITFQGKTYTSQGNPNYYPAGGSGTFEIKGNVIEFRDKNVWPAHFDPLLILSGSYTYEIQGDELILSKTNQPGASFLAPTVYRYNLKKVGN